MSVAEVPDTYHTLRIISELHKYCGINHFYGSPRYVYMILGMGLSVSYAVWQQLIDNVSENIWNRERHKIKMDDAMISQHINNISKI